MLSDPVTGDEQGDAEFAREVLDAGQYLVLATADAHGSPWPTPVWFAREGREFVWVSRLGTRHSDNLAERTEVGLVVFETPVPATGRTRAVYAEATAGLVADEETDRCLAIFDRRARAAGVGVWTKDRVTGDAGLRLFHALADHAYVLHPERDQRREVMINW